MLKFSNFNIKGNEIGNLKELYDLFIKQLNTLKVKCAGSCDGKNIQVSFTDKKYFVSSVTNKIPLKEGDPRIKQFERNYLESHRLTKEQFGGVEKILTSYFQRLGVSYNLTMQEFANDGKSVVSVVENGIVKGSIPVPSSFPLTQ